MHLWKCARAKMQKKVTKMQMLLQECILGEHLFRQSGWYLWAALEPMRRKMFSEKLAISTHSNVYSLVYDLHTLRYSIPIFQNIFHIV